MRSILLVRRFAALLAAVFLIGAPLGSGATPVQAASASAIASDGYYTSYFGEELMRLTNLDRTSLGKTALKADPVLIALARDTTVTCPSDSSLKISGRSKDMATRDYFTHLIPGCAPKGGGEYNVFAMAAQIGFTSTAMAENIGWNNYPTTAAMLYKYGCDVAGANCKGTDKEQTPQSVGVIQSMFMKSAGHRNSLLNDYTSFGCAAWHAADARIFYTCLFAKGDNRADDTTGPAFSAVTGHGVTYAEASAPTFSATVTDAATPISDGSATFDGVRVADFANTAIAASQKLTVTAPALDNGIHTLVWTARDAGGNRTSRSVIFSVGPAPVLPSVTGLTPIPGTTGFVGSSAKASWKESNPASLPITRSVVVQKGRVVTPGSCAGVTYALDKSDDKASPLALSGLTKGYCYRVMVTLATPFGASPTVTSGALISATPTVSFTAPTATVTSKATSRKLSWTEYDPAGSGIASRLLTRYYTSISSKGTCGTSWTVSGTTTSRSSYSWPLSTKPHCYKWTQKITTRAGFTATATSPILKRP